ncbi:putative spermidine/putrescine transport system permease protein [Ochrobactrum intermedium]|jgi:putative spermidine/putrescine transport system permease protein|uniref:Spermidine/putrescine transport system permease protein n=1 Tax=Brucella intermedia TaxID=94625 RepID=A0ABR6AUB7_9HYPH|nr:ABC transporter permease [Brucella intermedia]KAB2706937.1 ABC transporter permease [Brucella intermedia]MBA8853072.1 putative spermidine/putrescine transport system permease protein [Brucella intermedia]NYD84076.1 putative spermidine/putrescine transport system permease protein [Brucella intermedia]
MTAITSTGIIPAKPSRRRRYGLVAVALLLPMALINLIAFIAPVAHLAQISFLQSESGGVLTDRYTFENYINFFTDSFNWGLVFNSLWLSAFITLATLICAYPIALFLHRVSPVWRNFLFVVTVSPLLVSSVVRTYGWMVLLGDQGLVNGALMNLGIISSPIRLVNNTLGVFIGMVEILIPYMALSLIAGFGRLNASLEEAAASLGANAFTRFRRIILPLTLPGIALGCLLCFVLAISSFITPKLLGGGRVFLLATEIYDQAVIQLEWPRAAATSVIVLIIFGLALMVYSRIARRID